MTTETLAEPIDVLVLLLRRWRTMCVFAALGLAGGITYACLATRWYAATITVIPSQRSPASESAVGVAAGGADAAIELAIDVQRIKAVLSSRSVRDAVIDKFSLGAHYGTADRENTRGVLDERCNVGVDKEAGLVTLTCEDASPKLAAQITEFFGEEGNRVFGRISVSSAREERAFLEQQVEKTRNAVDAASRALREFQQAHRVIDLPDQSRAVISAMAAIEGEVLSKQLELAYQKNFAADSEATVVQLGHQLASLKAKLQQLENTGNASGANFFPSAMSVPDLRFQLEALLREQKIQETLFFAMTQRYEMAKVDEARDTSTFQILDQATVPIHPSRPKRVKIVEMSGVAGLVAAWSWILVPVAWRRRMRRGELT